MLSRNVRQLDEGSVAKDPSHTKPELSAAEPSFLFFFDLEAPQDTVRDATGSRFASLDAARVEGLRRARELIAKTVRTGELDLRGVITIRNEALDIVDRIRLTDALKIRAG